MTGKFRFGFRETVCAFIFALELCAWVDVLCAIFGGQLAIALYFGLAAAVFLLCLLLRVFAAEHRGKLLLALLLAFIVMVAGMHLLHAALGKSAAYRDAGTDSSFFSKRVMVIVPHQDDDICLAGGVIEKFATEGSEVKVVFTTNGDHNGTDFGMRRLAEAAEALKLLGLEEDDIIFMGYGNDWTDRGIYFSIGDEVCTSFAGNTETYGSDTHAAYRQSMYTRNNYIADMKALLLEYQPDIILCSDLDAHDDHKTASLIFETAMGQLLKDGENYHPLVLKGFAYSTAFYADGDFFAENLRSSVNPYDIPYMPENSAYVWNERVRLPVDEAGLSHYLTDCLNFKALKAYASQLASEHAEGIINSDRVFWQRDTDSVSYTAQFSAASGDTDCLNDFKLYDLSDFGYGADIELGIWIPEDEEKTLTVELLKSEDISEICLYDNPSETDNVLNAEICFEDGTRIKTGALNPLGQKTSIPVGGKNVRAFTLQILEAEGQYAGLGEIEVYRRERTLELPFIKLMNESGDFIYDYYISPGGEENLGLYTYGCEPEAEELEIFCDGDSECSAELIDGVISVVCPAGKDCRVTVEYEELSDSVYISNPWIIARNAYALDEFMYNSRGFYIRLVPYRILKNIYHTLIPQM